MELQANQKTHPESLLNQSISKLCDDDVFLECLNSIQDVPKQLLKRIARRLSAYGISLLESKYLLKSTCINKYWKVLYFQISDRFYEPMSKINSPGIDMKDLYFQRIFHELLQCFCGEVESSSHLQRVFEKSRIFSSVHNTLMSKSLERLKKLLNNHLVTIRIYPRLLKKLYSTILTSHIFQQAVINIKAIELRDFIYVSEDQLYMLKTILTTRTVPNLVEITFVNCKFNHDVMEWFNQMTSEFGCEVYDEQRLGNNADIPSKIAKIDSYDEITFDDAICFGNLNNGLLNKNTYISADSVPDISDIPAQSHIISSLLKVAFVNCHFDQDAINKLCIIMTKLQNLKSFTFCPEWKCSLSYADRILPSLLHSTSTVAPDIEEIKLEDCPLGYYSQKLLLWHQAGECMVQHGISVPKPKHLKMADCNLDKFQVSCSCFEIKDFQNSFGGDSEIQLSHAEKCDSETIWKFDVLNTCSCNWLNLLTIDLSDNKFGERGAEALAKALESSQSLQLIKLSFCSLNTKGCSFIFNMAASHKNLKSVDLSHNSYDGRQDTSLSKLIENGTITELALKSLFVPGGLTTEAIKSFHKNSTIEVLDLSMNRICDPLFATFIDVLADPLTLLALQVLELSQNLIQPKLISKFAESLELSNRKLKDVRITGNLNDMEDGRCCDIIKRRVKKFSSEGYLSYQVNRVIFGMADHVSEM